jgi:hypothetical protein
MTPRIPPDNDDWTRRWLRSHRIPCEGDRLDSALESLDSAQWARLKAAWRKSEERRRGGFVMDLGRVLNRGKKLGSIWRRLIAWRVISEADALLLANDAPPGKPDATFYSDSGARLYLSVALGRQVDAVRKQGKQDWQRED